MKKITILLAAVLALSMAFISCANNSDSGSSGGSAGGDSGNPGASTPDYFAEGTTTCTITSAVGEFTITAKGENDKIYKESDSKIILISKQDVDNGDDAPAYNLSGNFLGQILNKTKGSVLNLNGVTLSNADAPAIYGEKKVELSAKKDTVNVIAVAKKSATEKLAAVQCDKGIEIGGSGILSINGSIYHGVKGGDVKVKGSGTFTIQGTTDGSAINCETFYVKDDTKSFTLALLNSKNGINADKSIEICRGKFILTDLETGLKTGNAAEKNPYITLGVQEGTPQGKLKFTCSKVTTFTKTEGECKIASYVEGVPAN